ncbi:hypothetical protein G9A89_007159 [Geosiphon pyriformis]|nr:hypothetical protein G9A89_007159 [Geosiphon pyriformis]
MGPVRADKALQEELGQCHLRKEDYNDNYQAHIEHNQTSDEDQPLDVENLEDTLYKYGKGLVELMGKSKKTSCKNTARSLVLYSKLFDFAIRDPSMGMDVYRSEGSSLASANCKNWNSRDALNGEHDMKCLKESLNLGKTIKDIFGELMWAVNFDESCVNKLHVVGMFHFSKYACSTFLSSIGFSKAHAGFLIGLYAQLVRVWQAGGSALVFKKEAAGGVQSHWSCKYVKVLGDNNPDACK